MKIQQNNKKTCNYWKLMYIIFRCLIWALKKRGKYVFKNVGVPVVAYNKIMAYRGKLKEKKVYYLSAGAVVAKAILLI